MTMIKISYHASNNKMVYNDQEQVFQDKYWTLTNITNNRDVQYKNDELKCLLQKTRNLLFFRTKSVLTIVFVFFNMDNITLDNRVVQIISSTYSNHRRLLNSKVNANTAGQMLIPGRYQSVCVHAHSLTSRVNRLSGVICSQTLFTSWCWFSICNYWQLCFHE